MRTIGIRISYDGSKYHGWQAQPHHTSVQQTIELALAQCGHTAIRCHGASRTDAGVHASGQYAHIHTDNTMSTMQIRNALNALLPSSIRVRACNEHTSNFHARYSSVARSYCYRCYHNDTAIPWRSRFFLHLRSSLNIGTINRSMRALIGRHDFGVFCKLDNTTAVHRMMHHASMSMCSGCYQFNFTASGFGRNMVRSIVGTLVHTTDLSSEFIKHLIGAQDRSLVGTTAPPHGLYLQWVHY